MLVNWPKHLLVYFFLLGISGAFAAEPADPFEDVIRKTDPLTPAQERHAFHLPPGFEIQLVASEPQIGKPMNMAFDARGRLWITQSREYPFPVLPVDKKGRDKVQVLEDFAPDGHARKITTFVDGLNIPIGLYPYKDGVIAFSIPKIHFFRDTNGDGHADKDEVLLTGFGYEKDTHGLTSNFRRGYDGWIYADHGFNNDSTVVGRDGSTIKMNSGNCYRFQPDGTRISQHSFGQVNPFGLMFDPLGDLWSSDCHSSPTYVLMRGAYYPSFGKPNDGLGFAPEICKHRHGSTAIAGMVFYDDDQFPAEYRGNTFIGNVMTCRINRDSYVEHGSTRIAKEEPDFLWSDDPWFRPVMLEFGPDGAIYMADFYNRIIGHYEVPLDHPGRDRERGRIWRIVYTGKDARKARPPKFDLAKASTSKLIAELASPNITRRMLATDQLVDRVGASALKPLSKVQHSKNATPTQKVHSLWALNRLGGMDDEMLASAATDNARVLRVHAMKVLGEITNWTPAEIELARRGTSDVDAYVQRAAVEALGRHPMAENVAPLLHLRETAPTNDEELIYVSRVALRNQLMSDSIFDSVKGNWDKADQAAVVDIALGLKTGACAVFLLNCLEHNPVAREELQPFLQHIAHYGPDEQADQLRDFTREHFPDDIDFQFGLFKSIREGIGQRGSALTPALREWATDLAQQLVEPVPKEPDWRAMPVKGHEPNDPWSLQKRKSADGEKQFQFVSSLPGGEKLTGVLQSRAFVVPPKLAFFLAGHDGPPGKPLLGRNFVRLRDAATGDILTNAVLPRKDVAQPVTWDLQEFAGRNAYLELVDGNSDSSFAWLAVGRFDPPIVKIPAVMPVDFEHRRQAAAELASDLKIAKLEEPLDGLLVDENASTSARVAAAKALMTLNASAHQQELVTIIGQADQPHRLREGCARALAESGLASAWGLLAEALAAAPQSLQTQIALQMASHADGAEALLNAVEHGKASPRLLQDKTIKDRLVAAKPPNVAERLESLTKGLPTEDAERQKLIDHRAVAFAALSPAQKSAVRGAEVFKQNCAVCHSIDRQGANIGPQLDGVGNRGADRLIEDVLDPSRNVDPAFRVTLLTLKDGDVESGLLRREEGEMLVIADSTGKEHSIPKSDITERRQSQLSLMPDNFSQAITPKDFNDLIAFLLSKGMKSAAAASSSR
jgi:putative heme-binding domain-containing protein